MPRSRIAGRPKFQPDGLKDPIFGLLFAANVGALGCWVAYAYSAGLYDNVFNESSTSEVAMMLLQGKVMSVRGITPEHAAYSVATLSICMAFGAAMVWMALLQCAPETVAFGLLYVKFGLMLVMAIAMFAYGLILSGLITLVFSMLVLCIIMCMANQIKFSAKILKCCSSIYSIQPGIFLVATMLIILQCVWQVVGIAAMLPAAAKVAADQEAAQAATDAGEEAPESSPWAGGFALLLFAYYWGTHVVGNLLHVSCCGVVGRWYFNTEVDVAVSKSTGQAFTNYFGSICFGSLLIAIVQTLRYLAEQKRDQQRQQGNAGGAIVMMILACLLSVLERMVEIFNTFAFVVCAIYGTDYITSGYHGMNAIGRNGCEGLLRMNIVGMICFMGSLMAAGLITGVTVLVAWASLLPSSYFGLLGLFAFVATLLIFSVVNRLMESGADTLIVCFAEEPKMLKLSAPEVQEAFDEVKGLR